MALHNDLLLRVLKGEKVERPPIWLMRQAGRILPEYRAVRERVSGFIELVQSPDLVAEVTLQPVDALGVDAAILFSDILVVPEAMGLPYEMVEARGPFFPKTIENMADVEALISGDNAADKLEYVYEGINKTLLALNNRVPLIGFSGAPFTLFCYMVEGKGSKTFSKAKKMLYTRPDIAHKLLQKITDTIIAYLKQKIKAGVNVVQIFDSWAGVLDSSTYDHFSIPYLRQINEALKESCPVILFPKGAWFSLKALDEIGSSGLGIDWNIDAAYARNITGPTKVLQGNLDPCVLYANEDTISREAIRMCNDFGPCHIANLGHGVYPDTPLDNVKHFVNTVKQFRYS
ncbi:MAG TPA: uroporphyrinogen decarboxylase [Saprospiraceae bacterium]|nr:uroporphyrinogen decarboxylase [Saprospiraceae bacterium]